MQFPYPTAALIAIPLRTTYLSLRTAIVPPAVPIRSAESTDPASCSDNCATERTDPVRRYDISTAAHIIPHACRAHHSAAHLFNVVSALYFH